MSRDLFNSPDVQCFLFSALSLMCTALVADAHNGKVAHAYPIKGITIDGDLSDWPESLIKNSIDSLDSGKEPSGPDDFSARFGIGYDLRQQSLYVAVEVTDDHNVQKGGSHNDSHDDGMWLLVDGKHSSLHSAPKLYDVSQTEKRMNGVKRTWDPSANDFEWKQVDCEVTRKGTTTVYEWKVSLENQIFPGNSIGLDMVIYDKDADDGEGARSLFVWGRLPWKRSGAGRCGDIILVPSKESLGTLRGKVNWPEKPKAPKYNRLRIVSLDNPKLWIHASVDESGIYEQSLPVSRYAITSIYTTRNDDGIYKLDGSKLVYAEVRRNEVTDADPLNISFLDKLDLFEERGILHAYNRADEAKVDRFIEAYMSYCMIPGASIALIKDRKVAYAKHFGVANTFTQEPVHEKTLFEAASITKPVFAFAVMRLAERGIIDLDKPLYEYLSFPAIAHDERYKLITARHILSHQSGFPNWRRYNDDGKMDIRFTPGTGYRYSGEGYEYLGRVAKAITGKDLNTILDEEVKEPLRLDHMYFSENDQLQKYAAAGHYDDYPSAYEFPKNPGMAWSMHTEAKTFALFALALMNKKGLSKTTYDQVLTSQVDVPKDDENEDDEAEPREAPYDNGWPGSFGLGLSIKKSPYGRVIGHGGNNGDFRCNFEYYEDSGIGFVVFTNSSNGYWFCNALGTYLITGKTE